MSDQGAGAPGLRLLRWLLLLWLAGITMRIAILAVPPVIPLIHADLALSETQVGLLMGLPLAMFAIAALPGSLLIARFGALRVLVIGMVITAVAGSGRGAVGDIAGLYLATLAMGAGVAIMQPAVPALVREWLPDRPILGSTLASNGMLVGATLTSILTYPVMLPAVGGSWRLDLVAWSMPILLIAIVIAVAARHAPVSRTDARTASGGRWWPDWRSRLTWMLGLTFGFNNAVYFGANAFLPDYLTHQGRADLIGHALGAINGAQFVATFILMFAAGRISGRLWPYLVFGSLTVAGLIAIMLSEGPAVVAAAGLVGFSTAMTFAILLALPAQVSAPGDVHRTAAGMFTISYSLAVVVPVMSGAVWDISGIPAAAFAVMALCGLMLTVLGAMLHRAGQSARSGWTS